MKVKRDFQPIDIRIESECEYQVLLEIFHAAAKWADMHGRGLMAARDGDLIFKIRQFRDAIERR